MEDYREEAMMVLAETRDLAVKSIRKAKKRYKAQYDKNAAPSNMKLAIGSSYPFQCGVGTHKKEESRGHRGDPVHQHELI